MLAVLELKSVFNRLWKDYKDQNPSVGKIHDLFINEGEEVVNDHIAFRTLDLPEINIEVLAKPFALSGYLPKGEYVFKDKHLLARHFELPDDKGAPRVSISQLILKECSAFIQETFTDLMKLTDRGKFGSGDLIFSGALFDPLSYEIYNRLREESEYAAWFYVFRIQGKSFYC